MLSHRLLSKLADAPDAMALKFRVIQSNDRGPITKQREIARMPDGGPRKEKRLLDYRPRFSGSAKETVI